MLWIRILPRVFRESGIIPTTEVAQTDDLAAFVKRFGKANTDKTDPGPPGGVPHRLLTYGDLRIVFAQRPGPNGPVWKIEGFIDTRSDLSLRGDEALDRMLNRR